MSEGIFQEVGRAPIRRRLAAANAQPSILAAVNAEINPPAVRSQAWAIRMSTW